MPVILRFLIIVGMLAGAAYAGMFALATLHEPQPREVVVPVTIPRPAK